MPAYKPRKACKANCEIATNVDRKRYLEDVRTVSARVTKMWATENQKNTHIMALELSMENFGVKKHVLEAIGAEGTVSDGSLQEKFFRLFLKESDSWKQGGGKADIYSWQFLRAGTQMERSFERKDCKEVSQFVRQITHIAQQLAVDSFKLFNLDDKFDRKIKCYNGFINLGTFDDPGMDEHLDNELTADGKEQEFFTVMVPIYCVDGYGKFCLRETLGSKFETPLTYDLSCAYALNNRVAHYVRASKCTQVNGRMGYRMVAVFHFQITKKMNAPNASPAVSTTSPEEVILLPLDKEEVKTRRGKKVKNIPSKTRKKSIEGKPANKLVKPGSSRAALAQIPAEMPMLQPDPLPEPVYVNSSSSSQSSSNGSHAPRPPRRESVGPQDVPVSAGEGSFIAYKKGEPNPSTFLRELPKAGKRRARSSKGDSQSPQDEEKQNQVQEQTVKALEKPVPSPSPAAAAAPSSILATTSQGPKVVKSALRAPLVKKPPSRVVAKKPAVVTAPTHTPAQGGKVASSKWTHAEDALLLHLVETHGKPKRWAEFENAFLLKGFRFRGARAISHRWSRLKKSAV